MNKNHIAIIGLCGIFCTALYWKLSSSSLEPPQSVNYQQQLQLLSDRLKLAPIESEEATRLIASIKKIHKLTYPSQLPAENPEALIDAFASLKTNYKGESYLSGYRERSLIKAKSIGRAKSDTPLDWKERGPGNVSGRVRSLVVDPSDSSANTWFASSIGGGIWKTSDGGVNWVNKTPNLSTLSTTSITMAESNPDVIYVGTGMGFGRVVDLVGSGVWKSIDHGESWAQVASTANGELLEAINRIIVDPNDPNTLLVCSNDGFSHLGPRGGERRSAIFKSTNGGQSWNRVFDSDAFFGPATDNRVQQLLAEPGNFNRLYATVNEVGVILSDDAGETWSVSANDFALASDVGVPTGNGFGLAGVTVRTEMAISQSDPSRLYAAVERPTDIAELYMSQDRGASWSIVADTGNDPNWFNAFGASGAVGYTAGWFDNTITVHPDDPNTVFVGGVNIYQIDIDPSNNTRSTNPIAWWIPNAAGIPVAHADHHSLHAVSTAGNALTLIDGNDGGVSVSVDGGASWTQTTGMVTTQFYGVDKMPGEDIYIGGLQDNGSWRSPSNPNNQSQWTFVNGGDGFEVAWHATNPNLVITSSQGGSYARSTNGGQSFTPIPAARAGFSPFISKIANSKSDPELLFTVGFNGVNRSDDFGATWTLTPIQGNWLGYRSFDNVEISVANPQVVWISSRLDIDPPLGSPGGIHVSTDGGLSFTEISTNFPNTVTESSGIGTHPTQAATAYMLFAAPNTPKILRTTDLGQTWEDISGFSSNTKINVSSTGFPDVPVYSLLVMPYDTNVLWAGTDIGLVISEDSGLSWHLSENGLPSVAIFELSIVEGQVLAATQGRGIWTLDHPQLVDYQAPEVALSPRLITLSLRPNGKVHVEGDLRSSYDQTNIELNGQMFAQIDSNEPGDEFSFDFIADSVENVSFQVVSQSDSVNLKSAVKSLQVYPVNQIHTTYASNLDQASDANAFINTGMSLMEVTGFSSMALHSAHPYLSGQDATAQFKDAIVVPCSNSILSYDEVVLVEPGAGSGVFGDPAFFDFVAVESSRDGINWQPLTPGYDSRIDPNWLSAFNALSAGTEQLYIRRTIDLRDTLNPGDEIFLRFRLFADAGVEGWGWAIDNIELFSGNDPADTSCNTVEREGISGLYYAQSGAGWMVESLPNGQATVYWFTYPPSEGGQKWIVGTGPLVDGVIHFDESAPMYIAEGGQFGDDFSSDDVSLIDWGPASFTFDSCRGGFVDYTGPDDYGSGRLDFTRLASLNGLDCELSFEESSAQKLLNTDAPLAHLSGSWIAEPGEGIVIQMLETGGVFVVWFTFTPDGSGEQVWIVANIGPEDVTDTGFTLANAIITDGAKFGSAFDPNDVNRIPWGSLSFEFDGCNNATVNYNSSIDAYGSGSKELTRLTQLEGSECPDK